MSEAVRDHVDVHTRGHGCPGMAVTEPMARCMRNRLGIPRPALAARLFGRVLQEALQLPMKRLAGQSALTGTMVTLATAEACEPLELPPSPSPPPPHPAMTQVAIVATNRFHIAAPLRCPALTHAEANASGFGRSNPRAKRLYQVYDMAQGCSSGVST